MELNNYDQFVGLEIHIQLKTASKIFCGCSASYGAEPNSSVCPVCLGYPGVLPTLNSEALRMAYVVARALNCRLATQTLFSRKNYFYPDLPKNYQISQHGASVGQDGHLEVPIGGALRQIRIREVHLEEDAGKMIHVADLSLVDYNRTGTPLVEVVTEPDLRQGPEAEEFLQHFRRAVRYLGVCDGNMEEGSLRCDANISLNSRGRGLGAKVEVKNLNSFKFVRRALDFESQRQREVLEAGGAVTVETRLWNENRDVTETMRLKEDESDYRYFPEPDLPPFHPDTGFLAELEAHQVEFPWVRAQRLIYEHSITAQQAAFLTDERDWADFFEAAIVAGADSGQAAHWLAGDVRRLLNRDGRPLQDSALTPKRLAELLRLITAGDISGKIGKQVLELVFSENRSPQEVVESHGLLRITEPALLTKVIDQVLAENPVVAAQLAAGDGKPASFVVGQVMKHTDGRAEPRVIQSLLRTRYAAALEQTSW